MHRRLSFDTMEEQSIPSNVLYLQQALLLEKERNEIISSLFDDWVYEYNIENEIVTTLNGSSEQYHLFGDSNSEQTYLRLDDLHPDDRQKFIECSRGMNLELGNSYAEVRIRCNGEYRWISLTTRLLCDTEGVPVSVIGKLSDINEKKKIELQLIEEATKDALTGLLNRTALRSEAKRLLDEVDETGDRIAVMLLDIDNFKTINDKYGHLYGDNVIISMADAMREIAQEGDLLGRFGGDEFTIILRDYKSVPELTERIERLRRVFTETCALEGEGRKITCSIGAAFYGLDGTELRELVANADKALYDVKEKGKNNFAFCTEQMKREQHEIHQTERMDKPINEKKMFWKKL